MGINVYTVDTPDVFNYIIHPEQNPVNQQFLAQQREMTYGALSDIGRKFYDASLNAYTELANSFAVKAAKAMIRKIKNVFQPDKILDLETYEELQMAPALMQRYIMANPVIRELYHQQRIDGYSETYTDIHPNVIGEEHYDYRRVMNGAVRFEPGEDGEESNFVFRNYLDDLVEGDRELTADERADLLGIWELAELYANAGVDPTNTFGGDVVQV